MIVLDIKGLLKRISFFLPVIITSLILFSCNDEPTSIGSNLLQDTVTVYPLSTSTQRLITGDSTFLFHINTVNKGVLHIGKANGVTALSLVRFNEPIKNSDKSNKYDFLVNYTIDKIISCKIKLFTKRYTFGDSTNPNALSFKVYAVNKEWSNKDTWETLDKKNIIDKSNEVASFNGSITQKDTMDVIELDLDKNLFLEWVKKWYNYKLGDSSSIVWGLAFVPDDNSSVIRQFAGASLDTSLIVKYLDSTGAEATLGINAALDKPFYKIESFEKNELAIQGATTLRGLLFFDISMIPPMSAIHSAQFAISLNNEKSVKGNNPLDSTFYAELYYPDMPLDKDTTRKTYLAEKIDGKYVISSITSSVEYWNRNGGKGILVIHPEGARNERWELDKLTFYGPDEPDSTKRPSLKIIYSRVQGRK